ncbi:hypothetical protein [Glaciecola sp. 1036]|uniref:hypothetical protein n=1 Tax=Alteromonadaceae TaxID=72275 RepID=UPI003D004EE0
MLEQVARNLTAIENLSRVLGLLTEIKDRKLYTPMLKELLSSNFELQHEIGRIYNDLDPMYLGLEEFTLMRKKFEDPENPIPMPTQKDIENAKRSWERISRMLKK